MLVVEEWGSMPDRVASQFAPNSVKLEILRSTFSRVWQVDRAPCFETLLHEIDDAERKIDAGEGRAAGNS
jgi:hypothetical protein